MATRDGIKIDAGLTTAKYAPDLIRMISLLRETINQVEKVKGIMDHNTDGSSNYVDIETLFGLSFVNGGASAGTGAIVYALVAGSRSAVRSPSTLEIIDRVG